MILQFQHRFEAGQQLAKRLAKYSNRPEVLVLALPQGGVVVGSEVAHALNASFGLVASAVQADVEGRTVILVDDGIADSSIMRNAIEAARQLNAAHIIVATPTAAMSAVRELRRQADEIVSVMISADFGGVSQWYEDYPDVTDEEVREILERAGQFEHAGI